MDCGISPYPADEDNQAPRESVRRARRLPGVLKEFSDQSIRRHSEPGALPISSYKSMLDTTNSHQNSHQTIFGSHL